MRVCNACGQEKPLDDFRVRKDKNNWRVTICKPCETAKTVDYYYKAKERDPIRWRVTVLRNGRSRHITREWLEETLGKQRHVCALSGRPIDILSLEIDHIIPRRDGGGDELDNLQLVCREANAAKGALSHDELVALCQDIVTHLGRAILASIEEQAA